MNSALFKEGQVAVSYNLGVQLEEGGILLPANVSDKYMLMLCTEILVFDDIILYEYESGLTHPMIFGLNEAYESLNEIEFYYTLTDCPGFRYTIVQSELV
jgi:hypothetical protein